MDTEKEHKKEENVSPFPLVSTDSVVGKTEPIYDVKSAKEEKEEEDNRPAVRDMIHTPLESGLEDKTSHLIALV